MYYILILVLICLVLYTHSCPDLSCTILLHVLIRLVLYSFCPNPYCSILLVSILYHCTSILYYVPVLVTNYYILLEIYKHIVKKLFCSHVINMNSKYEYINILIHSWPKKGRGVTSLVCRSNSAPLSCIWSICRFIFVGGGRGVELIPVQY